ncbi:4Fe-4S dicluster domain-containing protein [candidate division TA06 bacterium]|uniref:4Fe-4S dicluster domain-containing protein n=1 Tax=candidate division TA06 bacterium TaxID=2250710 RepID=A0A523XTD4_UNCT6|nr:MAG: 4Fe-4S dicluster domain-containing protein [candidate division TA06 bacterium]
MHKLIMIDQDKCTGCRACEMVCSVKHAGVSNPARSRISVIKWESEGFYMPLLCQQCSDPACMTVCPKDAMTRDEETGRVLIDYDTCIKCKMCVAACPFGATGWDAVEEKPIKCDLCDGDPECCKICDPQALEYVDASTATMRKKRSAVLKFSELMRKFA